MNTGMHTNLVDSLFSFTCIVPGLWDVSDAKLHIHKYLFKPQTGNSWLVLFYSRSCKCKTFCSWKVSVLHWIKLFFLSNFTVICKMKYHQAIRKYICTCSNCKCVALNFSTINFYLRKICSLLFLFLSLKQLTTYFIFCAHFPTQQ